MELKQNILIPADVPENKHETFIKNYQPYYKVEISKEVALAWLKQIEELQYKIQENDHMIEETDKMQIE